MFSEIYSYLLNLLDDLFNIEFTAGGITFTFWGILLASSIIIFIGRLTVGRLKQDYTV